VAAPTRSRKIQARARLLRIGRATAPYSRPSKPPSATCAWPWPAVSPFRATLSISHGVRMTATKKENIIAAEALAGIGLI
jgi:hypothetical protein